MADNLAWYAARNVRTWEDWLARVRIVSLLMANCTDAERRWIMQARLVYSAGSGVFGATHHSAWCRSDGSEAVPVLSIEALIQEDPAQLCTTLLHEMGHILAAYRSAGALQGHNAKWRATCVDLGLLTPATYAKPDTWDDVAPLTRAYVRAIPLPSADGKTTRAYRWVTGDGTRPGTVEAPDGTTRRFRCSDGDGIMGGRSRGAGSGSRYLLMICPHDYGDGTFCAAQLRLTSKWARHGILCTGGEARPHDPVRFVLDVGSLPATRLPDVPVPDGPAGVQKPATGKRGKIGKGLDTSGVNAPLDGGKTGNGPAFDLAPILPWSPDLPLPACASLVLLSQTPQAVFVREITRACVHASIVASVPVPTVRPAHLPKARRARKLGGTSGKMKRKTSKRKTRR